MVESSLDGWFYMFKRLRGWWGPVVSIFLPLVFYYLLRGSSAYDMQMSMPRGHFYIVSSVALLAFLLAAAVCVSGSRLRNIKVTFLAMSFVTLAEVFTVHGLSTPGFLLRNSHVPSIAAQLSVTLAVVWLWLSSVSSDSPVVQFFAERRNWLFSTWIFLLTALGLIGLLFPGIVDFIPVDRNPVKWWLVALTILLSSLTIYRYMQSYRYSRFPLQLAVVYGSGWMIVAQWIMATGEIWRISWWLYHFLLLAAMVAVLVGLLLQYADKKSLSAVLRGLFTTDPVERLTSSISPSVRSLVVATESRDTYTAGHNMRVAIYALKLAEELGVVPEDLRAVAQGTIVHDVGKIHIPDSILNKPGRLSAEERAVIETHPVKGFDMCNSLGFMKEELEIIRHHHEKWDGTGYPDRLAGNNIPFLARIVAVADVYDALTSNRAYRQAWTHEQAITLLLEQKGTHFDPVCVDAWVRVCERNPAVYRYPMQILSGELTLAALETAAS